MCRSVQCNTGNMHRNRPVPISAACSDRWDGWYRVSLPPPPLASSSSFMLASFSWSTIVRYRTAPWLHWRRPSRKLSGPGMLLLLPARQNTLPHWVILCDNRSYLVLVTATKVEPKTWIWFIGGDSSTNHCAVKNSDGEFLEPHLSKPGWHQRWWATVWRKDWDGLIDSMNWSYC